MTSYTSAEIKEQCMKLPVPDYYLLPVINGAIYGDKQCMGFVTWDASPMQGLSFETHKLSILDAFQVAFAFLGTRCFDEWLVLGSAALSVVRTLPGFVEKPERSYNAEINFVGLLMGAKVYAYPTGDKCWFFAGIGDKCCRGRVHGHSGFGK